MTIAAEPILSTDRLWLRELDAGDLEDLYEIIGDAETMRFYPHPFSRDETRGWIEWSRRSYAENGFGLWAMVLRETGEFIGDCGLTIQEVEGERFVEAGWHVHRRYQRNGYATEGGLASRYHAFEVLGVDRLISLVRVENEPSAGVARNLGMTVWRHTERVGLDHYVFSLERPEWDRLRPSGA